MRIPTYRSQLSPTSEAPGRSIRARISPQAVAQAEMAKAAPASALIQNVGAYAKMRYNAEQELLLNEGLLEAEEGIRQAAYDLERSRRLSDVFGGEKLWKSQTDDLRTQVLDKIGTNRFTRQKFMARFDQMELTSRFKLKDVVDRKIEAAAQASFAARQKLAVTELSKTGLGNTAEMIELYEAKVNGIVADGATGVKQGRYSAEGVTTVTNAMKVDIAKNVVSGYVSTSPLFAVSLAEALEVQDLLEAGIKVDPEDMPQLPGGAYALHTLQNIPRDDAMDIIKAALTEAAAFQTQRDKQREIVEKQEADLLQSQSAELDELMLTLDPLKQYNMSDIEAGLGMFPGINIDTTQEKIAGYDILTSLRRWAFNNLDVSQEKNEFYLEQINGATRRPKTSNPVVHEVLTQKASVGKLTFEDVDLASADLTLEHQTAFFALVRSQGNEGMAQARRKIKEALSYDANLIKETNAEDAAQLVNEINDLYAQLDDAVESAMEENRPLSKNQIINFANDLIASAPGVRDIIDKSLNAVLTDATYVNAFPDIFTEVANLPSDQQPKEIIRLINKMLQESENVAPRIKGAATSLRVELKRIDDRYKALKR